VEKNSALDYIRNNRRIVFLLIFLALVTIVFGAIWGGSYFALRNPNPYVREPFLQLSVWLGRTALLEGVMTDPQVDIQGRAAAARALGRIGSQRAISSLIDELDTSEAELLSAAREGLILAGERAIPQLKQALLDEARHDIVVQVILDMSRSALLQFDLSGANLVGADLTGAVFQEANLSGADLSLSNLATANLMHSNLTGANLSQAMLTDADLTFVDFSDADLKQADLSGSDLSASNITAQQLRVARNVQGITLRNCDFSSQDLSGVNFTDADLSGCNLNQANLRGARLNGTILQDANLSGAILIGSSITAEQLRQLDTLAGADLFGLNFSDSDLSGLDFTGVNLSDANLSDSNLSGTIFQGAILRRTNLAGSTIMAEQLKQASQISGINLSGVNFDHAIFAGLDLSDANFERAILTNANLSEVSFKGANLAYADLSGSNITSAQLKQAGRLTGVILNGYDLRGANLSFVDLTKADLSRTLLSDANLSSAILTEANLSGVDLRSSILNNANLDGANLNDANLSGASLNDASLIGATDLTPELLRSARNYKDVRVQTDDDIYQTLQSICNGRGIPDAPAYPSGTSVMSTAILWNRAEFFWPNDIPWWINFLELVACVQEDERVIQVCTNYYYVDRPSERAPDIERIRYEISARIVSVQTGTSVDSKVFRGSTPRACRDREPVGITLYGDPIDENEVYNWIYAFSE
jgi:uncharacterized protein YjbI with pentapeptide repeats